MSRLHFVLCDDNKNFLDRTALILKDIFIRNDINATISFASTDPVEVSNYILQNDSDVLILDIDLNASVSGIDIAGQFRKINKNAYIIFLTGHFEYSMLAYKVKTFDYLVKPVTSKKIEETILRLYDDAKNNTTKFINLCNGKYLIKEADVLYIEKYKSKAVIHTVNSNVEIYGTFSELQSCLPENFIRCQKSYIVNVNKITKIDSHKNILYLNNTAITYSNYFTNIERMVGLDGKAIG